MKNIFYLSKIEFSIMKILWSSDIPLATPDIISLSNQTISKNTIHPKLNFLIENGFVEVSGKEIRTKVNARLYSAKITADEYIVYQIKTIFKNSRRKFNLEAFLSNLSNDTKEREDILKDVASWFEENQ